jgi:hypothetical protein
MQVAAPMCLHCLHFYEEEMILFACAAFPKGIPLPIAHNKVQHIEPYENDNGIQFEKKSSSKGGPGSGNFGHAGRPGLVGGSGMDGSTADIPEEAKQREARIRQYGKQFGVPSRHAEMLAVLEEVVWNGYQTAEGYWADLDDDIHRIGVPFWDQQVYKQVQIENRFLEEMDRIPEDVFASLVENRKVVRGFQDNVPLVQWEWKSPASPNEDSLKYIGEGPTAVGYWQDGTTFYKIPKPDYEEQAEKEKALYTAFGDRLPIVPSDVELDNFSSYLGLTNYPVVAMPYISSLSVASDSDRSMWLLKSVSDDMRARSLLFDLGVANTDRHYGNVGFTARDELVLIDNAYALNYTAFEPVGNSPRHAELREATVEAFTRNALWRTADDTFKIGKVDRRHISFIVEGLQKIQGYDTMPGQKLLENIPEGITWQELFSGYLWEVFA